MSFHLALIAGHSYDGAGAVWDICPRSKTPHLAGFMAERPSLFTHHGSIVSPLDNPMVQINPVFTQSFMLTDRHRALLEQQEGVEMWHFEQHLYEAVFIPGGCPHQVRNLASCCKVAVDFVSPESLAVALDYREQLREADRALQQDLNATPEQREYQEKLQSQLALLRGVLRAAQAESDSAMVNIHSKQGSLRGSSRPKTRSLDGNRPKRPAATAGIAVAAAAAVPAARRAGAVKRQHRTCKSPATAAEPAVTAAAKQQAAAETAAGPAPAPAGAAKQQCRAFQPSVTAASSSAAAAAAQVKEEAAAAGTGVVARPRPASAAKRQRRAVNPPANAADTMAAKALNGVQMAGAEDTAAKAVSGPAAAAKRQRREPRPLAAAATRKALTAEQPAAAAYPARAKAPAVSAAAAKAAAMPLRSKSPSEGAGSASHAQNATGHWGVRDRKGRYEAFLATNDFRYLYLGQLRTLQEALAMRDAAVVAVYGEHGAAELGISAARLAAEQVSSAAERLRKKDNVLAVMQKYGTA
eukprot:GHRR01010395.1.p1 GENE.GHRR01010395.1~~GHRR01010395.1.p1  ORF type:complete len:526 (+),score=239.63 GHRR01010395.1:3283-4860(+)